MHRHHDARALPCRMTPIALCVACALSPMSAIADEGAVLKDMVVSASKVEQATSEAPSNVSVVSSEKIENSNAVRLGDVLTAQVPSLYLRGGAVGNTTRDASSSIIALRGAYGARTKVVLNGTTSMSDSNSGNLNLSTLGLGDVERIEIVPGVSSSLYGSDAIGGVINIITKEPTKREFNARVVKGFGDGERTTMEGSYRDRFENGLGISLSYMHQKMSGYDKNDFISVATTACGTCTNVVSGWEKTKNNTGATRYIIGDRGAVPSDTYNFNGTLFFDISPTSKIKAGVTHYESSVTHSHYNLYLNTTLPATDLSIDGGRVASLRESSPSFMPGDNEKVETRYFAGYEGKLGNDYLLKIDASYFDRDYYYLSGGTTAATTYTGGAGTATHTPNITKDLSGQLSFPVGERHFLVAGLAFNRAELHRDVNSLTNWRDVDSETGTTDTGDGYTETNSIYLQDQISVTDALTLYAGARYDDWKTYGYVKNSTATKDIDKHGDAALSPRLAVVYKLSDAVSLKSSVGTAFRAPTLYDMYAADTVSGSKLIQSDASLKPERAKSIDFGPEITLPNGASFKAAYFRTRITDMIYSKETAYAGPYTATIPTAVTILSQKTNAAEGLTRGIELSGSTPLTGWLRAGASYTWTDARVTKDNTNTGLDGKMLVFVPKNMFSANLDAKYGAWTGNLLTRYSGLTYSNATNSDTEKEVFGGVSRYWITDMRVGYQIDKNFKLSLLVNNLFDKKYYEYYLMPGRNAAVELSAKF